MDNVVPGNITRGNKEKQKSIFYNHKPSANLSKQTPHSAVALYTAMESDFPPYMSGILASYA